MTPAAMKGSLVGHEQAGIFASRARGTQSIEAIKIGACTQVVYSIVTSLRSLVECTSVRPNAIAYARVHTGLTPAARALNMCVRTTGALDAQ